MSAATPSETTENAAVEGGTPSPDAYTTLRGTLPQDLRDHPSVTRHESFDSLAKEYVNAQSMIGRKGVILPKDDDPGDRQRFFNELGRPESPDKYALPEGFQTPEGVSLDEPMTMRMIARMHELGITQEQFAGIAPMFIEEQVGASQQHQMMSESRANEVVSQLQKEYGMAYEQNMNLVERALETHFGDLTDTIRLARGPDGVELGNNKAFIDKLLALANTTVREDGMNVDSAAQIPGMKTPEQAANERDRLLADPEFMKQYSDPRNIGHTAAVNQLADLYKFMDGQHGVAKVQGRER